MDCSGAGDRVGNNNKVDGTRLDSVGTPCSVSPDVLLSILKLEQVLHAVVNCLTLTLSGGGLGFVLLCLPSLQVICRLSRATRRMDLG